MYPSGYIKRSVKIYTLTFYIMSNSIVRLWADQVDDEEEFVLNNVLPPVLIRQHGVSIPNTRYLPTLHPSFPLVGDVYNNIGKNQTAQKRRQEVEPWIVIERLRRTRAEDGDVKHYNHKD